MLFCLYISLIVYNYNFIIFWFFLLIVFYLLKFITMNTENYDYCNTFLFKNNNFFKESFYIDLLQKKLIDNFFKKSLIVSTQLFNLNFFLIFTIKFIWNIFILNFYFINNSNDYNLFNSFIKIFTIFYLLLILIINIVFFSL